MKPRGNFASQAGKGLGHNTGVYLGVFAPEKSVCHWLLQKKLAGQGLFNGLLEAKAWTHLETHLEPSGWKPATCKALPGANDMDNDKNALYAVKLSDCCEGLMKIGSAWVKRAKSDEVI